MLDPKECDVAPSAAADKLAPHQNKFGSFPKSWDPNIDPKKLRSLLGGLPKGTPNFGNPQISPSAKTSQ